MMPTARDGSAGAGSPVANSWVVRSLNSRRMAVDRHGGVWKWRRGKLELIWPPKWVAQGAFARAELGTKLCIVYADSSVSYLFFMDMKGNP